MKIVCVGRNYTDHIAELKNERPSQPVLFIKPDTALFNLNNKFYIPTHTNNLHYECELVVRIGKVGKFIKPEFAREYISHITVGLDFTARDTQDDCKAKGLPWEVAKAFDNSAVVGELQTYEGGDLDDISFHLTKNNEVVQEATSKLMLWRIEELLAIASNYFTLKQGDMLFTGTPKGVGQVEAGDELIGFLQGDKRFELQVRS